MVFTRLVQWLLPCLAIVCTLHTSIVAQSASKDEESTIRSVLARFYDGWNTHDAEKMISVFADDIDHVNVFAEWHRGKADLLRRSGASTPGQGRIAIRRG